MAGPHGLLDLPQHEAKALHKCFLELVPLEHALVTDKDLSSFVEEVENDSPEAVVVHEVQVCGEVGLERKLQPTEPDQNTQSADTVWGHFG